MDKMKKGNVIGTDGSDRWRWSGCGGIRPRARACLPVWSRRRLAIAFEFDPGVAHPHAYPLASVHPNAPIHRQGRRTAARERKSKARKYLRSQPWSLPACTQSLHLHRRNLPSLQLAGRGGKLQVLLTPACTAP
jgi:hypothetical protein